MKKCLITMAVLIWGAMGAMAQKIQIVDKDGNGLPLVSVITESGTYIGTTDLNGVLADVAPCILKIMELPQPEAMTGNALF